MLLCCVQRASPVVPLIPLCRWRVDDLGEAGRNVNNWHWTEKDALPWAKQRLAALLGGVQLCPGGLYDLRITGLSKVGVRLGAAGPALPVSPTCVVGMGMGMGTLQHSVPCCSPHGTAALHPALPGRCTWQVEGEAVVNNRKKKMIVAYELDVRLDWEGSVEGEAVRGQIRLPYVRCARVEGRRGREGTKSGPW